MTTAIQTKPNGTIRSLLEGPAFREAVGKALPTHLTPDRFIRVACTTLMRTPKLAQCDQASFFNALLTLSQLGIEPDGRRAHLIPFENRKRGVTEVQLIIDYKGLVELAQRSGTVSNIHADVVCENDVFDYDRGEIKCHKVDFRKPRGNPYAAYCIAKLKDGTEKCEVMSREDIEGIRKRSRAANAGPWVTDWSEMAKKTVFRRLSKWLTLSPEFRDAAEADDDTPAAITSLPAADRQLVETVTFEMPAATEDEAAEADAGLAPAVQVVEPATALRSPQQTLEEMVTEAGFDFQTFIKWASHAGTIKDADSIPDWESIPTADTERMLRALRGAKSRPVMLADMAKAKEVLV